MAKIKKSFNLFSILLILCVSSINGFTSSVIQRTDLRAKILISDGQKNGAPSPFMPMYSPTKSQVSLNFSISSTVSEAASLLFTPNGNVPLNAALGINAVLFGLLRPKLLKVLTSQGFLSAFILGTGLWTSLGWKGWSTCVLYLGFGSAVTKVKMQEKEEMGIAEARGGRRGPENVWGSALTGLACSLYANNVASVDPTLSSLLVLAYVASISTKLSDTFASEIGKAYGKTTFLITNFKKVPPGTEGAVSLEGSIAALVGGLILPLYAYFIGLIPSITSVGIATISAFLATFAESFIGATLQEKKGFDWMTNEVVNFFNTVIGATLAVLLSMAKLPF